MSYDLPSYKCPAPDYLRSSSTKTDPGASADVTELREILSFHLAAFGIDGQVVNANAGPIFTCFSFEPGRGVRLRDVQDLAEDLAFRMKSLPGFKVLPIEETGQIGIYMPNENRASFGLKELLLDVNSNPVLPEHPTAVPIGRKMDGEPLILDIATSSHCLMAGSFGSGKTNAINMVLLGLVYKNSPSDLRFIFVDTKMKGLFVYNGIPHLREPVITGACYFEPTLDWIHAEISARMINFRNAGVHNVQEFNDLALRTSQETLPRYVIVLSEFDDLGIADESETGENFYDVMRLGVAAGFHFLLVTRNSARGQISSRIRLTLTTRWAFRMDQTRESRNDPDAFLVEDLLGLGDSLLFREETDKPIRVVCPLISEEDIDRVIDHLRNQPKYPVEPSILAFDRRREISYEQDPLYDEAVNVVLRSGVASTSLLERRMKIGHSRASRLLDLMELNRIVGPAAGAQTREILVDRNEDQNRR